MCIVSNADCPSLTKMISGVHEACWIASFISFFFLYPSTFNLLEVMFIWRGGRASCVFDNMALYIFLYMLLLKEREGKA